MSPSSFSSSALSCARNILFGLLVLGIVALPASAQTGSSPQKRLLGYYPSWGIYNTPPYTHDDVPYSRLTHISHAFALVGAPANGIVVIPKGHVIAPAAERTAPRRRSKKAPPL